jgi:tRNA (guanine37-N1)-methyltransferase
MMDRDEVSVSQWCLPAAKHEGETVRQRLLREEMLDLSLRVRSEGDQILFPVTEPISGAVRKEFFRQPGHLVLPRHELIGGIAILQERDLAAAASLLSSRPSLHTVLYPVSAVEGEYRTRQFEVLAGEETTKTTYLEYGLHFEFDLSTVYFSARLANERQRLLSQMEVGEAVLDMFAGAGPFAITLARRASYVVACDLNPAAVLQMQNNALLNRCKNLLPMLADAGHLKGIFRPGQFDRVVMNLPLSKGAFVSDAVELCRPGGTVHLYMLESSEGEALPLLSDLPVGEVRERRVRSYSPGQWHAVYDIAVSDRVA